MQPKCAQFILAHWVITETFCLAVILCKFSFLPSKLYNLRSMIIFRDFVYFGFSLSYCWDLVYFGSWLSIKCLPTLINLVTNHCHIQQDFHSCSEYIRCLYCLRLCNPSLHIQKLQSYFIARPLITQATPRSRFSSIKFECPIMT